MTHQDQTSVNSDPGPEEKGTPAVKAQELRIGNIVLDNDGNYHVADFITIRMAHNYKPVPLTPDMMVKCGGIMKGMALYIKAGEIEYYQDRWIFGFSDNEFGIDYKKSTELKYLHQLQNLYFALTGEELPITL